MEAFPGLGQMALYRIVRRQEPEIEASSVAEPCTSKASQLCYGQWSCNMSDIGDIEIAGLSASIKEPPMNVLVNRCSRQTQLVADMVDSWKKEHDEAMRAFELEELVLGLVEHSRFLGPAYERLVDMLFDDKIADVEGAGKAMRSAITQTIATFAEVSEAIANAGRTGYTIGGEDEFASAYEAVHNLKLKLNAEWPFINWKRVEAARRDFREGRCLSSGELLDAALREGFLGHQ